MGTGELRSRAEEKRAKMELAEAARLDPVEEKKKPSRRGARGAKKESKPEKKPEKEPDAAQDKDGSSAEADGERDSARSEGTDLAATKKAAFWKDLQLARKAAQEQVKLWDDLRMERIKAMRALERKTYHGFLTAVQARRVPTARPSLRAAEPNSAALSALDLPPDTSRNPLSCPVRAAACGWGGDAERADEA